jgi:Type IV secretory pathway, VirB3-like protein.
MQVAIIDTAEICQGATRIRTMLGVPSELCIVGGTALILVLYMSGFCWRSAWITLGGLTVYGWCVWQTKKDPQWLQTWWRHLQQPVVYRG